MRVRVRVGCVRVRVGCVVCAEMRVCVGGGGGRGGTKRPNVNGPVRRVCVHPSDSAFGPGVPTRTWTGTDWPEPIDLVILLSKPMG